MTLGDGVEHVVHLGMFTADVLSDLIVFLVASGHAILMSTSKDISSGYLV